MSTSRGSSQSWKALTKVRDKFHDLVKFSVGPGSSMPFGWTGGRKRGPSAIPSVFCSLTALTNPYLFWNLRRLIWTWVYVGRYLLEFADWQALTALLPMLSENPNHISIKYLYLKLSQG